MKIDPDKDFEKLIVVEAGKTRFIGIRREVTTGDTQEIILDQAVCLVVLPSPSGGSRPALSSMDYSRYAIDGLVIHNPDWYYTPADQDKPTIEVFKAVYFGMLEAMAKEQSMADGADIQLAPADAMKAIDQLAKGGKLPPGIMPSKR